MYSVLLFLSIIFLCVLIWLNKKNKEQFKEPKFKKDKNKNNKNNDEENDEENDDEGVQPNNFEELSVNNLLEIYTIINNEGFNKTLCDSDKSNIISKLQQTDIEDKTFIKTINSVDAYDSLINILKNVGKITYKPCDKGKSKSKSKSKSKNNKPINCDPICNCITDVDMCKNYTFLKILYNDNLEETAIINNMKTGKYINPEITTWTENTESTVDELKDILPSIFFPVEKSDSMW